MVSVPASSRPITASRKKALSQSASMVIIPASLADIVEAVGGVTGIALVDARLRSGCALRDHAEMLHEVTGRRLMALGALRRIDRWMAVIGDLPAVGLVAARAVGAEQALVRIAERMAARAIARGLGGQASSVCRQDRKSTRLNSSH